MAKKCPLCRMVFGRSDEDVTVKALAHWIDAHPESDRLADIMSDVWVKIDCFGCGQSFFSPVSHGVDVLSAEAYCPECVEEDPLRRFYAREMPAEAVVACQANPAEDDLPKAREEADDDA